LSVDFEAHWTRVMENVLDWPRLPFVHKGSIGRGMYRSQNARMDLRATERPTGYVSSMPIDGVAQPGTLELRFPNLMVLNLMDGGRSLILVDAIIPIGPTRSRLVIVTARSSLKLGLVDGFFHWTNRRLVNEDERIVESSRPLAAPHPSAEQSVRTEAATLFFRKRSFDELHESCTAIDPIGTS
jgi:phenylpropionate dioxygenase-like ring-hydroxylating dioxygenase large terminal subunit